MSWLQWNGEQWETTRDEAELIVQLRAPDTGGRRFGWTWHLFQSDPIFHADRTPPRRWLTVEVTELGFAGDWRQLSGFELLGSPAWYEEFEHFGEYGQLSTPRILLHGDCRQEDPADDHQGFWEGDQFTLGLGERDGSTFPCGLDGWLRPRSQFYRETPETDAELAMAPIGEPNLHVVTRTRIRRASVNLPRCGDDPVPRAREYLEEFTGLIDLPVKSIEWWGPALPGQKEIQGPGWRSTVNFRGRNSRRQNQPAFFVSHPAARDDNLEPLIP